MSNCWWITTTFTALGGAITGSFIRLGKLVGFSESERSTGSKIVDRWRDEGMRHAVNECMREHWNFDGSKWSDPTENDMEDERTRPSWESKR